MFPWMSVAVQVTTLVPIPNTAGASFVTEPNSQLSTTSGVPRLILVAVHWPGAVLPKTAEGAISNGAASSTTITKFVLLLVLPDASIAVKTTSLVPKDSNAPATGVCVTVTELQRSTAM